MGNDPKLARLERRRRALLREQQQLAQDNATLHSKAAVLGAWCQCFQFLKSANTTGLVDGASTLLAAEEAMLLQQLRAADAAGAVAAKGLAPLTVPGTIAPQGGSGFVAGHMKGGRGGLAGCEYSRAPVEGCCCS